MNDPLAAAAIEAIHAGGVDGLRRLLDGVPALATVRVGDDRASRTLLRSVADWPGHFPRAAATVAALVEAGADVDARFVGRHRERPLHWAASSGDVAVLDALLVAGARHRRRRRSDRRKHSACRRHRVRPMERCPPPG